MADDDADTLPGSIRAHRKRGERCPADVANRIRQNELMEKARKVQRKVAADLYLAMLASWYEPEVRALGTRFPRLLALCDAVASRPSWKAVQAANA